MTVPSEAELKSHLEKNIKLPKDFINNPHGIVMMECSIGEVWDNFFDDEAPLNPSIFIPELLEGKVLKHTKRIWAPNSWPNDEKIKGDFQAPLPGRESEKP